MFNSPANTIQIALAQAIKSHAIMNGTAVAKIVFFLPKYSIKGPPAIPPAKPANGIRPPTHEALLKIEEKKKYVNSNNVNGLFGVLCNNRRDFS